MSAIRLRAMKIGSVGFGQLIGTFALLAFATVAAAPSAVPADLSFVAVFVDAKTESRLGAFPFDRSVLASAIRHPKNSEPAA